MDSAPESCCQVDVYSTWRECLPEVFSQSMNTEPLAVEHVSVQTTEYQAKATQTKKVLDAGIAAPPITPGVAPFVARAATILSGEVVRAQEEYEILEPLSRDAAQEQEPAACLFELRAFNRELGGDPMLIDDLEQARAGSPAQRTRDGSGRHRSREQQKASSRRIPYVTSLSWSATGQTIGASFGRYDVEGWCTDRGALATWNLGRESINQSKPDVFIDTDVALMTCAFHPEHPALIAGGTFNGDLYIWDLSLEGDTQRGRSDPLCDLRHQEPILSIVWQYSFTEAGKYGTRDKAYRLVTLGEDGRVLVWIWHKLETPLYGYQLLWPAPGLDHKVLWGGTCMSFAKDIMQTSKTAAGDMASGDHRHKRGEGGHGYGAGSIMFMAGTEGGKIFRCFFDMNDLQAKEFQRALAGGEMKEKQDLRCPIKEASYVPHAGSVYSMDCSPYQRDLFLSAGADGSVRLYHALRQQPLLTMEPTAQQLYAVQWSPSKPLVFAASGGDGRVYLYDLLQTTDVIRPALVLDAGNLINSPTYALAFNSKKSDLLATGDAAGIKVWRLPGNLADSKRGEGAYLRKLAGCDDGAEALRLLTH